MSENNTALILRVTGEVQESNISDFEKDARAFIDGINTKLVTDQDFGEAKDDIKECKEKEIQIANAKQKAINSMAEISKILTTVDKFSDEFRDTRLMLDKLVKTEETNRKNEIINNGVYELRECVSGSPVENGFCFQKEIIVNAIKGKRSLAKMEEAVTFVVYQEIERLAWMELAYERNIVLIEASLIKFPGIHPDKGKLVLEPTDKLELIIGQREAEQALLLKEKVEKEAADIIAKIEAGRIADEQRKPAEAIPEPVERIVVVNPATTITPDPFLNATIQEENIPLPSCFDDVPIQICGDKYSLLIDVITDDCLGIVAQIRAIPGIIKIMVK